MRKLGISFLIISISDNQSPTENMHCFPWATLVDKRLPHTSATPFLASLRRPMLYQAHFGTNVFGTNRATILESGVVIR